MCVKFLFIIAVFSIILTSCGETKPDVEVKIRRFERELMAVKSQPEMATLLQKNENIVKSLYRTFPDDTAFVSHMYYLASHPETRKLYDQTQSEFGELADIQKELEEAFVNIKSKQTDAQRYITCIDFLKKQDIDPIPFLKLQFNNFFYEKYVVIQRITNLDLHKPQ